MEENMITDEVLDETLGDTLDELVPDEDAKVPFCKTKVFKAIVAGVIALTAIGIVVAVIAKIAASKKDED